MNKRRCKIVIRGIMLNENPKEVSLKIKGDLNDAMFFLVECLIRWCITSDVKKKDLLEYIRGSYEDHLKEMEENR